MSPKVARALPSPAAATEDSFRPAKPANPVAATASKRPIDPLLVEQLADLILRDLGNDQESDILESK